MLLYNFHSSPTSYRVRIALELKGIDYHNVPVQLAWDQGEHDTEEFREFNPQRAVPVLVDGNTRVAQSVAILEYLEDRQPLPPLFPDYPPDRAWVRSLVQHVACEIQPLSSMRVERYLTRELGTGVETFWAWQRQWMATGFDGIEAMLEDSPEAGPYCYGDTPTIADCFLVPQVLEAQHPVFGIDISRWPNICGVYSACAEHPAFRRAHPRNQPGARRSPREDRRDPVGTVEAYCAVPS